MGRRLSDARLLDRLFESRWQVLSEQGHCDGLGGSEYRRVMAEWVADGRPWPIEPYIRERANIGPHG